MELATRRLLTSKGRPWAGFFADLLRSPAGVIEQTDAPHHQVLVHAGAPARSTCRYDGRVHRGLKIRGQADIVPAGMSAVWEDEDETVFLLLRLPHRLMRTAAEGLGRGGGEITLAPRMDLADRRIEHIAWAVQADLAADRPAGRLYAESLGLALACHLVAQHGSVKPAARLAPLPRPQLRRVIDHIEAHIDEDLSLARLAAVAGLSPSHFKALFRRAVGMPVHQYVIRRRVERAKVLLIEGRSPMSEIALAAGFAHQSHMARAMRRVLGATPSGIAAARR